MATAQEVQATAVPRPVRRRRSGGVIGYVGYSWYLLRRYPIIPGFILGLMLFAAIFGPWLAPFKRDVGSTYDRFLPMFSTGTIQTDPATGEKIQPFEQVHSWWPNSFHLLGTDSTGRDMFTRLLYGARIDAQVVLISLGTGLLIGMTLGVLAGYYGGIVDEIVTRFVDIWNALPFLMVALVVTLVFGNSIGVLFIVLAMIAWAGFVRILRSQVLVLREMDYVASARINGASDFRIMFRHMVPGILNTAVVVATLNTSGLILAEAVLSFVGAGIQPPTPAWGTMTNEGRNWLSSHPHVVLLPAGAIFLVVLSLNFVGDWLRDRLDPRLRQVD